MIPRRPCYIAAPYGDDNPVRRAWNVARACLLARLAVAEGRAPIVVHPAIVPVYGLEETPEARRLGLEVDEALVELVARTMLGELWILETDAGELTSGTRRELTAWIHARGAHKGGRRGRWSDFSAPMAAAGLGEAWAALASPPSPADLEAWAAALASGGRP